MNRINALRITTLLVIFSLFLTTGRTQSTTSTAKGWAQLKNVLAEIKLPAFPSKDFSILNYGAKGDGTTDCTEAFKKTIEACNHAGGGRVVVPGGVYLTGAIHLKSNVNLYVSDNATIKFSTDPNKYLPVVFTRFESTECYNYSPLIYALGQEN
ncbi:MAG: glycosyl hydrolase family 28-related protein, partial [Bacteroidota bacterium]|nr:glycosyl hydrolase family 28-related protein [Bacteroidota bacterium]